MQSGDLFTEIKSLFSMVTDDVKHPKSVILGAFI